MCYASLIADCRGWGERH